MFLVLIPLCFIAFQSQMILLNPVVTLSSLCDYQINFPFKGIFVSNFLVSIFGTCFRVLLNSSHSFHQEPSFHH